MIPQKERRSAATAIDTESRPFWDAAAQGKMLLGRCRACGAAHYYPRSICPHCFGTDTEWTPTSGRGTIYSYSVTRRVDVPYVIAYVTLPEGVTVMSNIVECDFGALQIGQEVELTFRPTEGGQALPVFSPCTRPTVRGEAA